MTKKLFLILSAAFTLVAMPPVSTSAEAFPTSATPSVTQAIPLNNDIRYVYKTENGKTYKRLFDYSTNQWIGDWILVG